MEGIYLIKPICGKISQYLHSDTLMDGKCGSMVRVTCQTDFAAKTTGFVEFASKVAKFALAATAKTWEDIVKEYPQLEEERVQLSDLLKETITVDQIVVFRLEIEVPDKRLGLFSEPSEWKTISDNCHDGPWKGRGI